MSTFSASIVIDRPILDVFSYVCDPERLIEWVPFYTNIKVEEEFQTRLRRQRVPNPEGMYFRTTLGFDPSQWLEGISLKARSNSYLASWASPMHWEEKV